MKSVRSMILAAALTLSFASAAMATPSTQVWIPSPDVKGFGEVNFGIDSYIRFSPKTDAGTNIYDVGATVGVLPFEKLKLEIGIDYLTSLKQDDNKADNHPFYFNAKLGTPEDAFFKGMPSLAVGVYNMGTYDKIENGLSTRQNIAYGLVGKTLPVIGRLSAGGYYGSERALATTYNPSNNNSGIMASWDRSMTEISDKLWLAVDYMSGNNANGALSFGGSWAFNKNVSLLVGTVFFNPFYKSSGTGDLPGGKPAFTTQLDINF
jgi:hypothetical protein